MNARLEPAPEVLIVRDPAVPASILSALEEALTPVVPSVGIVVRPAGAYAAWEWILPAAVLLYMARGFADAFFKELGTAGAKKLAGALGRVFAGAKDQNLRWATLEDLDRTSLRTPLAIEFSFGGHARLRLVFPAELDEQQFIAALDTLPEAFRSASERLDLNIETRRRFYELLLSEPREAVRTAVKEPDRLLPEVIYVYLPARGGWQDGRDELAREIRRAKGELRARGAG